MTVPDAFCPLCGASGRRPVGRQIVPELDYCGPSSALPYHTISYQACGQCGTVSQDPLPAAADLDRYYASIEMERHVPGAVAYKEAVYTDRLALLREVTGLAKGRCLEVGCGNGILLKMIAAQWGLQAVGLEPSGSYDTAETIAGVSIVRGTLEGLDPSGELEPGSFDLVVCRHVLEHVPDPCLFLDHLAGMVASGGWLLVEVPSRLILARSEDHHCGMNIHVAHLHHFTGPGLAAALRERGLDIAHLTDRAAGGYPSLCLIAAADAAVDARFEQQLGRQQISGRRAADRLVRTLEEQEKAGKTVLIWGAGADLLTVLEHLPASVQAGLMLFDRNPSKQGKTLLGATIMGEARLAQLTPAVILAGVSNRTLIEDIREEAAGLFADIPCRGLFSSADPPAV